MQAMGAGKLLEMEVPLFLQVLITRLVSSLTALELFLLQSNTNIRRISAFAPNIITTIAGTGASYYASPSGGPATSTALAYPQGV